MPAATTESLFGGVWVPEDGFLDPHAATYALADAARALGVADPHRRARDGDRASDRARGRPPCEPTGTGSRRRRS